MPSTSKTCGPNSGLSDLACEDIDLILNSYGVRTAPELFPPLLVGVVMILCRVARVAGDNLVHRHSIRTGFTRCNQQVKATEKGEDISESETPCERCYDPDR
jgi:hypothetical protein